MRRTAQHAAPTGTEADVRNNICRLLERLRFDEFHLEYRTRAGSMDIYLPRQRTVIETKAPGLGLIGETALGGQSP